MATGRPPMLSIGYQSYDSGKVLSVDVENSEILHSIFDTGQVTSLDWINEASLLSEEEAANAKKSCFEEKASQFLPKLPALNKSYGSTVNKGQSEENNDDPKRLKGQTELNLLIVGNHEGIVSIYAYGIFPCGVLDTTQDGTFPVGQVARACFSPELKTLSIVLTVAKENQSEHLYILTYDATLIASRHLEISIVALKYGQVASLLSYLDSTIRLMSEAWEDILMEMDSKLMKFAEEKQKMGAGTVSNDFLELLMFGTPSDELQAFLLHGLTEKGLKKLGHSIETSYSNIQRLVLKQLQSVIQSIIYHLNDLYGMSQWYDKFGVFGMMQSTLQQAIIAANSFMLKASELHLVIDRSMKNFKAFFRWLYVVIQRLRDEPVPPELNKMTQQSLNFVADFLKEHFTEEYDCDGKTKPGFRLECVGQYLKNEELQDPPDNSSNPWIKFVESHPNLKGSPLLYPVNTKKSLIQTHEELKKVLKQVLGKPSSTIGKALLCAQAYQFYRSPGIIMSGDTLPKVAQYTVTDGDSYYMYTVCLLGQRPAEQFYIFRQKGPRLEAVAVKFGQLGTRNLLNASTVSSGELNRCSSHKVLDVAYYDEQTISLLLVENQDDKVPVLVQMQVITIRDLEYTIVNQHGGAYDLGKLTCIDGGPNIDNANFRRLENMKAHSFAVSGTRKVSCVVFSSHRRVRLFYMDVEDEEEDDDEEDNNESEDNNEDDDENENINVDMSRRDEPNVETADNGDDGDEDKENTSMEP